MSKLYTAAFTAKRKSELKAIDHATAKRFLLKYGYSSTQEILPEYYRPSGFEKINLEPINWSLNKPKICTTKPLALITPKGKLSWRNFSFNHPYIFLQKVETLTERSNWNKIKKLLCVQTLVNSYSVPVLTLQRGRKLAGVGISSWIQMAEKDIIKDAAAYHFLTVTDIQNFYPSIYTHSIAWAFETKTVAKEESNRGDYTYLGNRVDRLFMQSRDGQTNGIPVGSILSDLIAEVILTDVDRRLSQALRLKKIQKNVVVTRYRDDYKILSKNEHDGTAVLKMLSEILRNEYDLHLNAEKTKQHTDIVEGSFRPEFIALRSSALLRQVYNGDVTGCSDARGLRDCLLDVYMLQRKFPDRNAALTIVSKLGKAFTDHPKDLKITPTAIPELIALLRKLTLLNERMTPSVYILLNILFKKVRLIKDRQALLETTSFIMTGGSDNAYQMIWFHRLCWAIAPKKCIEIHKACTHPLIEVLRGRKPDYKMFDDCKLSRPDARELKSFTLIDRKLQNRYKGKDISPKSTNPFSY